MSESGITLSIVGENGAETVIPVKSWSMNAGGPISAASFGPGSKTWTIPPPAPQFRFGDVVRYRKNPVNTFIVLFADPLDPIGPCVNALCLNGMGTSRILAKSLEIVE